jgi:hypothetical protein
MKPGTKVKILSSPEWSSLSNFIGQVGYVVPNKYEQSGLFIVEFESGERYWVGEMMVEKLE